MSRCDKPSRKRTLMNAPAKKVAPRHDRSASHLQGSLVWLRLANGGGASLRNNARRATLLALAGLVLAGCDLHSSYHTNKVSQYLERTDTLSLGGGDAVASNKVLQMQDPWPVASANRNLTMHGHVAASAIERYRTGKVIPPIGMGTSSTNYQQQSQGQGNASSLSAVPTSASQATP